MRRCQTNKAAVLAECSSFIFQMKISTFCYPWELGRPVEWQAVTTDEDSLIPCSLSSRRSQSVHIYKFSLSFKLEWPLMRASQCWMLRMWWGRKISIRLYHYFLLNYCRVFSSSSRHSHLNIMTVVLDDRNPRLWAASLAEDERHIRLACPGGSNGW